MKNKEIERQLKALASKMPNPEFKLIYDVPQRSSYNSWRSRVVKLVLTFSVVSLFLLGGICTANAEFRDYILTFLKIKTVEEVPFMDTGEGQIKTKDEDIHSEKQEIKLVANKDIEDILTVQYIESEEYIENLDGLIYYQSNENGENKCYKLENGKFVPVDMVKADRIVKINGIKGRVEYSYVTENSSVAICDSEDHETVLSDGSQAAFGFSKSKDGTFYLEVSVNPQTGTWTYPVKYNIETGEMDDFLKNLRLKGKKISDLPLLMNWSFINDKYVIVTAGTKEDEKKLYLIDTYRKSIKGIEDITGISDIWGANVFENKLFIYTKDEDCFDYISYDLATGEKKVIYKGISYWHEGTKSNYCVDFVSDRYALVKKNGIIYLSNQLSGQLSEIKGMTEKLLGGISNDAGDKIMVSGSYEDDYIKQIGILDINKSTFYLFDRKVNAGVNESSVSWCGNNSFSVNAEDLKQNKNFISFYKFKE